MFLVIVDIEMNSYIVLEWNLKKIKVLLLAFSIFVNSALYKWRSWGKNRTILLPSQNHSIFSIKRLGDAKHLL